MERGILIIRFYTQEILFEEKNIMAMILDIYQGNLSCIFHLNANLLGCSYTTGRHLKSDHVQTICNSLTVLPQHLKYR